MKNIYGCLVVAFISINMQANDNESVTQNMSATIADTHKAYQSETQKKKDFAFAEKEEEYGFEEDPFAEYIDTMNVNPPAISPIQDYFYSLLGDILIFSITMKTKIDEYVAQLKSFVSKWVGLRAISSNK